VSAPVIAAVVVAGLVAANVFILAVLSKSKHDDEAWGRALADHLRDLEDRHG